MKFKININEKHKLIALSLINSLPHQLAWLLEAAAFIAAIFFVYSATRAADQSITTAMLLLICAAISVAVAWMADYYNSAPQEPNTGGVGKK